jgi:hypothetical protein
MYLKVFSIYVVYNYFLKTFFTIFNRIIYSNHLNSVNQDVFFE